MSSPPKKTRWQSCNILRIGVDTRELWSFTAGKSGFTLAGENAYPPAEPLPAKTVAKDWRTLLQPRLNVALLPIEKVFLRVLHLPVSSFDETLGMVELQLEKISPLPVTQIAWSIQILPHHDEQLQTVLVVVVSRDVVEETLGKLEADGYLADRLEVPMIDQLQSTPITGDGAWVYPGSATGKFTALVAWWYGGVLQGLGLLHLPPGPERGTVLEEQLKQMVWAGELEGWLKSTPQWHIVADEVTGAIWQPLFFSWLGHSVDVQRPVAAADLATLTANRAARSEPGSGIMPVEYANRYHQQFIDRLWIRGLGTVLGIYVLAVFVYFMLSGVQEFRTESVETKVMLMSNSYTNALKLKAQLAVLEDRQALKFASLNCWMKTAELMPESLTLQSLDFKNGRTLTLNGSAPADQARLVTDFNEALRKATLDGQPLFDSIELPVSKLNPGGASLSWSFSAELARGESP